MKEKTLFFYLIFIILFVGCKQESKSDLTRLKGHVFGTTYNIIYKSDIDFKKSIDSVFKEFNSSLSTYDSNSIISRVNKGDESVNVDDFFIEAFDKAKRIHRETDGYFDPTIGRLIDAYGFGSGKERKSLTSGEIKLLMKITGFEKIQLIDKKLFKPSEIEFNVNAFAKGLGIDIVGRFLESKNINDYLIEIGGEIRARGEKKNGLLWKVAIDDPNSDGSRSSSRTIELDNVSMATSGNYRKFKINSNGNKIVHTVNPKTGLAQESNLLSVSVISEGDCADVDAYATAFLAMGLEKTKLFLKKHTHLSVILLYVDKDGVLYEFKSKNTNY